MPRKLTPKIKKHLEKIGQKGGQSRSPEKLRAIAKNLKLARWKRYHPNEPFPG